MQPPPITTMSAFSDNYLPAVKFAMRLYKKKPLLYRCLSRKRKQKLHLSEI